jgi:hypothetical protein
MSHKNSLTTTIAAQVIKLGMEVRGGEEGGDSETWRSNNTVVETVVLDGAIEKQSTEAASDNLHS